MPFTTLGRAKPLMREASTKPFLTMTTLPKSVDHAYHVQFCDRQNHVILTDGVPSPVGPLRLDCCLRPVRVHPKRHVLYAVKYYGHYDTKDFAATENAV